MTASTTPLHGSDGRARRGWMPSPSIQAAGRSRTRIAGGVALLVASTLFAVLVYGNLGERAPVLAAAREVRAGEVVQDGDLKVVRVAAEHGVGVVAASRRSDVVGRRATSRLVPGSLLAPGALTSEPPVPAGTTVIGAVVKPGQYPLGLREGDRVLVLVTGSGTERAGGVEAVIVSVSTKSGPDGTAISLAVPPVDAPALARAGAEGRLLLAQPVT
jgi:hypothetical protein